MWGEGTSEQQCGRLAVSIDQTGPKRLRNVLESLIVDDQAHRAAPSIRNRVGERLFNIPGAERIITDLAQRSPKQRTKSLVGHNDEHSRGSGPSLDHRLLCGIGRPQLREPLSRMRKFALCETWRK